MKVIISFAILAALMVGCEEKQAAAQKTGSPELSQDTINLGKLSKTVDTSFSVTIFNPGNVPVAITAKAKSCGCTQLEVSADTIPAHGHVAAKIGFKAADMAGAVTKSVFFRYNTGEISILRILAEVDPI